jgi:hypothetical protein
MERLVVSKEAIQRFYMERFNLKKLNQVECKAPYQTEISNSFAALENSNDDVDINRVWETIMENKKFQSMSLGYY